MTLQSQLETFINRNISVNKETLDFIVSTFFKYGNKRIIVDRVAGAYYELSGNAKQLTKQIYGFSAFFGHDLGERDCEFIGDFIMPMNEIEGIEQRRDLLAKEPSAFVENNKLILVQAGLPKFKREYTKYDNKFITQYKKHFPLLDTLIDMILENHISPQKNSFFAIEAPSNAGKTLLITALKEAGLTMEVDYKELSDRASVSPYKPSDINNSLSLVEDEFTYFHDSMKRLTFSTTIAPKGQMAKDVKIGLKLMFFANSSVSFDGGVDVQVSNRVMYYEWNATPITEKAFYASKGFDYTIEQLSNYIRNYAEKRLQALSKKEYIGSYVYKKFEEYERIFSLKNKNGVEDIDATISEAIVTAITEENHESVTKINDEKIFIGKPSKTLRELLETQFEPSKAKYLSGRLPNWIKNYTSGSKPHKIFGEVKRGIIINPNELYNAFVIEDEAEKIGEFKNKKLVIGE